MNNRVLVSILSDNNIPNYLFIKEMEGRWDTLVFISTSKMDDRRRHIITTLGVENDAVTCVTIDSDDYNKSLAELSDKLADNEGDAFLVNLTGGTKMMSLAVYKCFSAFERADFFYVSQSATKYHSLSEGVSYSLDYRVSLEEYFGLYGIRISREEALIKPAAQTFSEFNTVRNCNYRLTYEMYNASSPSLDLSAEDRRYYGGAWFEEYSYLRIKKDLSITDERCIAHSVKIYQDDMATQNSNELDVVFIKNNQLCVVECKVGMTGYASKQTAKDTIEQYLYKSAAISKDFGIKVKPYIFTIHNMNKLSPASLDAISKRCDVLGVTMIGRRELSSKKLNL